MKMKRARYLTNLGRNWLGKRGAEAWYWSSRTSLEYFRGGRAGPSEDRTLLLDACLAGEGDAATSVASAPTTAGSFGRLGTSGCVKALVDASYS
jgi:hypothetical protein